MLFQHAVLIIGPNDARRRLQYDFEIRAAYQYMRVGMHPQKVVKVVSLGCRGQVSPIQPMPGALAREAAFRKLPVYIFHNPPSAFAAEIQVDIP